MDKEKKLSAKSSLPESTKEEKDSAPEVKNTDGEFNINQEEMARAGLHFGHKTSRVHPKIKPYLFGVRSAIHIIDLEKTAEKLKEALGFIQKLIEENKTLLLVGTKIQVKDLVKNLAQDCELPYVTERWLGGTFTNFEAILKRTDHFKDLERQKEQGELEKYTKKERAKIDDELKRLRIKFEGIKNLKKLPDAIFVVDMREDALSIKEAKLKGIKIIAIADTNVDPTIADYPIPANDDAIPSVKYILEKVKEVILAGKSKIQSPSVEQGPKPESHKL